MSQSMGVISLISVIALFIVLLLFVYPKIFLRFGFSKGLTEGIKSKDKTHYLPNDSYLDVIEKYELVKNYKSHKKYAVITIREHINAASFAVYSFDIKGKCFDYMKVSFSDVDNQVVIEVNKKTFGLNIVPISYNEKETGDLNESGIRIFRSKLVAYSVTAAFTSALFSFLFSFSLSLIVAPNNPFYIFSLLNIGIYILMLLLVMVLVGVGSYLTIFFTNRKHIDEAVYE